MVASETSQEKEESQVLGCRGYVWCRRSGTGLDLGLLSLRAK